MQSLFSGLGYYSGITSASYYAYINVNDYFQGESDIDDMTRIADNLYISNYETTCNKKALEKNKISHIISCVYSLNPRYPEDFIYKNIPLLDNENEDILPYIVKCNEFIDDAIKNQGGNVLVHCMYGHSRSVSILAGYLIYLGKGKINVKGALEFIEEKRGKINPNLGYLEQLEKYYQIICQKYLNKKE